VDGSQEKNQIKKNQRIPCHGFSVPHGHTLSAKKLRPPKNNKGLKILPKKLA